MHYFSSLQVELGPVTNVYLKNLSPLTEYTVGVFALYDAGQSEALSGGFTTSETVWSLPVSCLKMFKWVNSVILYCQLHWGCQHILIGGCGFMQIIISSTEETGPIGIHYHEHGQEQISSTRSNADLTCTCMCIFFLYFPPPIEFTISLHTESAIYSSWKAGMDAFSVLDKASLSRQPVAFSNHWLAAGIYNRSGPSFPEFHCSVGVLT